MPAPPSSLASSPSLSGFTHGLSSITSGGPYESLLPEIAKTSNDRLSVNGFKVYYGAAGGAIGLVGSGLIIDYLGFRVMALTMAVLAFVFRYVGTAACGGTSIAPSRRRGSRSARPPGRPCPTASSGITCPASCSSNRPDDERAALPYYVKALLGVSQDGHLGGRAQRGADRIAGALRPAQARAARRSSKRRAFRRAMPARRSSSRCSPSSGSYRDVPGGARDGPDHGPGRAAGGRRLPLPGDPDRRHHRLRQPAHR